MNQFTRLLPFLPTSVSIAIIVQFYDAETVSRLPRKMPPKQEVKPAQLFLKELPK